VAYASSNNLVKDPSKFILLHLARV